MPATRRIKFSEPKNAYVVNRVRRAVPLFYPIYFPIDESHTLAKIRLLKVLMLRMMREATTMAGISYRRQRRTYSAP